MVIEGGFDAEYFMQRMPVWEAMEYLASIEYRGRDYWERARLIALVTAQVNSTKKIRPDSIIRFVWDKIEENQTVSEAEKQRLEAKAKYLKKKLYG